MKVGDLIRVVPRHYDGVGDHGGQLGVIITLVSGLASTRPWQHIMMMDGSKVWLSVDRLEVVNETR
jgi:hypothetical protein